MSSVHTAPDNWAHVEQAPPDAILGVAAAFNAETRPDKVNLSIGAYRDETGKPVVLRCVRKAEALMMKKHPGHEYLPVCYHNYHLVLCFVFFTSFFEYAIDWWS